MGKPTLLIGPAKSKGQISFAVTDRLDDKMALSVKTYKLNQFIRYIFMGKPTIYIGENKDADQLRGNREADQRICFRYSDSTIPLLSKSKISCL